MQLPKKNTPQLDRGVKRKRYADASEREAQILEESIRFFADHGFSGSTRDLAKQIGITQPLLFRYFESKEVLIERIYKVVFIDTWKISWEATITDRSKPLRQRLEEFYESYLAVVFDHDWMRLYVHAGVTGVMINHRFVEFFEQRILRPLCVEIRKEFRLVPPELVPISANEVGYLWNFHGGIFYHGVRRQAFRTNSLDNVGVVIRAAIDAFLDSAPRTFARLMD